MVTLEEYFKLEEITISVGHEVLLPSSDFLHRVVKTGTNVIQLLNDSSSEVIHGYAHVNDVEKVTEHEFNNLLKVLHMFGADDVNTGTTMKEYFGHDACEKTLSIGHHIRYKCKEYMIIQDWDNPNICMLISVTDAKYAGCRGECEYSSRITMREFKDMINGFAYLSDFELV